MIIKLTTINIFILTNCTIICVCILLILVFLLALRCLQVLFVLDRLLYWSVGDIVDICRVTRSDIYTILSRLYQPNTCSEQSKSPNDGRFPHKVAAVAK